MNTNTQTHTVQVTPAQAAMIYRALGLEFDNIQHYHKHADRLELTPDAAVEARQLCQADMETCLELLHLFYTIERRPA